MAGKVRYVVMLFIVMCMIYIQQTTVSYAENGYEKKEEEMLQENESDDKPEEGSSEDEKEDKKDEEEGETDGKEEGEKPKIPVKKYETDIPKAEGNEGYYRKRPTVTIRHISERGETKYCLKQGDNILDSGTLSKKDDETVISRKRFLEGKQVLYIWMIDENGEKIEQSEDGEQLKTKKEFYIDTKEPEIKMNVPEGFAVWYQKEVELSVSGEDTGSGVVKLSCKVGGKTVGSIDGKSGKFRIAQSSAAGKGVEVTVSAEDKAGNRSEFTRIVYIDTIAPKVKIAGIQNFAISGKPVNILCEAEDENILQEFSTQIIWENVKGKKQQIETAGWKQDGERRILQQTLNKDGVYDIKVWAKDMSGHTEETEIQIIIDKKNPVIRYVDRLQGKHLKKLEWNYLPGQFIEDFTTYIYELRLDGKLYHAGKKIQTEGRHKITVQVIDAAGNKAKAEAEFVIDHTAPEIIFYNVEGNKEYEEERTFKVGLAGEEDTIRKIQINGKSQEIHTGRKTYEYTLHEYQDYEIIVEAYDKAGNVSEKKLYFSIVPKETVLEGITKPVINYLQGNHNQKQVRKNPQHIPESRRKETTKIPVFIKIAGGGAFGLLLAAGVMLRYRKRWEDEDTVIKNTP